MKCQLRQVFSALAEQEPLALDLLARLLAYDPNRRMTAPEAMHHPYFAECERSEAAWAQLHEAAATSDMPADGMPAYEAQAGARQSISMDCHHRAS